MILVTGATGTVGRHVIEQLLANGSGVRAVSRTPENTGLPSEVEVVGCDLTRPDLPDALMDGVTAVFVNPAAVAENAEPLVALARRSGVARLVVLAANNVADDESLQPSRFLGERNREVEAAVVGSGVGWVSLRPAAFHSNALHWAVQLQSGDVVRGPYRAAQETTVDPRDIAAVAALALGPHGAGLTGRRLELTGPQALSQEQMVAQIGAATGRTLRYQEVPSAVVEQGMAQMGAPDGFAEAYVARLAHLLNQPPQTTGTVPHVLGRPAISFAQWARDHVPAFQAVGLDSSKNGGGM
jgi:uncharacterized protein YbjT (DUF2867 family)